MWKPEDFIHPATLFTQPPSEGRPSSIAHTARALTPPTSHWGAGLRSSILGTEGPDQTYCAWMSGICGRWRKGSGGGEIGEVDQGVSHQGSPHRSQGGNLTHRYTAAADTPSHNGQRRGREKGPGGHQWGAAANCPTRKYDSERTGGADTQRRTGLGMAGMGLAWR